MKYQVKNGVIRALIDNNYRTIRQIARDARLSHSIIVLVRNGKRETINETTAQGLARAFMTTVDVICEPKTKS